jgi:transcriptional regulator with GAF, ATPase, and Fis domain
MKTAKMIFFHEVTTRLCSSLKIEIALMRCFTYLKELMPLEDIFLSYYDPDKKVFIDFARADISGGKRLNVVVTLPRAVQELVEREILNTAVKIINDPGSDPVHKLIAKMRGKLDESVMSLPLNMDNQRIGSLILRVSGINQYSKEHASLISLLHDPFAITIASIKRHEEIRKLRDEVCDENRFLSQELRQLSGEEIIGGELGLKHVMDLTRQVAPLENPVLILGETGVGKDLIANAIHYSSPRKNGPFIKVNCGAISESLLDSELFGHEKGSFTGAANLKRGRLERAHNGTLFLDEIGELPLQAQVKLLRALQHNEIERVGGAETIPIDIRVIAATHRNIEKMITDGGFREDLWYRVNVFPITVPPLRHRKRDIPALAGHFLKRKCERLKLHEVPPVARGAIDTLMDHDWKGNVRELENVVERALIRYQGGEISFDEYLSPPTEKTRLHSRPEEPIVPLDYIIAHYIKAVLVKTKGKINGSGGAAELLKIHPSTLRNKMNKLSIKYGKKDPLL